MTDPLRLVKMSGAGNDFLVLDSATAGRIGAGLRDWVRRACRRGLSLGADGVVIVEKKATDRIGVTFHNPDGSIAFCGNGSRCAARFANLRGLAGATMTLETAAGDVPAEVLSDRVRLRLPPPVDHGPLRIDLGDGEGIDGRHVDSGAPHFVVFVESVAAAPLARWGPRVRRHRHFGDAGTNFDLVERMRDGSLALRTWERGVEGETLACGTGAVACAHAARLDGGPEAVTVVPTGGVPLRVRLPGPAERPESAYLSGDARLVFEGVAHAEGTCGF